jgi:hypothetical protein
MIDQVVSGAARHEIAFVSGDVPDLQNLLLGMRAGIEVVVLDPASDGGAQIAQALAGRSGLDAIHLIGHGAAGALQLGDAVLDAAYIASHADALAFIGGALNGGGDILVYGCDTGAGSVGDTFLHALADATGADVAASTDPTGGTAAGGDWTLEASVGQVDTAGAIAAGEAYAATLALADGTAHTYSANTWAFSAMAKDAQGNVYLAHKIDSTAISLKKWNGSGWTELKQLKIADTGDTSFSDDLSLTVNANGKLDLLFRNDKATNGDFIGSARGVKFAEFDPVASTWNIKQIEQASDPSGWKNFDDPMIATGAGGKMYAVYNYADANNPRTYNIKYAESSDGGNTWTKSTLLTTLSATDELKNPKIAVDADGTVHVFYVREDSQNVNYGNLYEITKAANAGTWSAATKLADNLTSAYSMTSDGQGHFYLGYAIRTANASNQTTGTNLYTVSNEGGSWGTPSLVLNEAKVDLVGQMQYADGKPYMLVNSRALDNSTTEIYVMRKDASGWTHGVQGESALPALSMQGSSQAFGERNFIVKSGGDIIVVAEDSGLRNIYYSAGTSNDFGLLTNTAPVVTGLGGDHGTFSAGVTGTANLVNDNAYIDVQLTQNDAVGVADDSADFAGGSILILQTGGTANGSFVLDDGAEVTGTLAPGGTIYYNNQVVGRVNALLDGQGGHNLLIEFTTADANKLVAENIVKFLMYSAPTAGTRSFMLTIEDGDGGTSVPVTFSMQGMDVTAPAVTGVTSSSDNGSYKVGDTITIQLQFSEAVNVTGTPKLVLETGATDHAATYSSGSGSNTLSFNYTVQAGDTSSDLDAIATGALQLNGGTILDAAGNAAVLALPAPGAAGSLGANKAIVVDGLAPSNLALSNATVTTLDGAHAVVGQLSSTDATSGDSFTYTLVSGTGSTDNAAFEIVGQSLKAIDASGMLEGVKSVRVRTTDAAGNSFEKVLSITVNTPPTVAISSDKSTVKAGDTAAITFHFSSAPTGFDLGDVSVAGGTLGSLAVDQNDPTVYHATFTPAAGTQNLGGAISVGAGKFLDANGLGNVASTTNVAIGGDTALPAVTGVSSSSDNGSYKVGDTITIQVQFSEAVNVTGTPKLVLETGATDHAATYSSGSGSNTLSFNYTVQAGDTSTDLDAIATGALQLNGGTILDAAGNAAVLALPAPGAAGSLGANKAIVVDGLAPSNLALSNATVTTLDGAHAVVGQLSSTDATSGDSFTYTLVSGTGSTDNAAFEIVGQSLKAIDASGMLEGVKSVRVRTTDAAGNSFEKVLSITVNTPPTVAISSDKSTVKAGDTAAITFHFSSAPTGFDLGDVSVAGGTLGSLAVDQNDPTVYHAIFTPAAGVQNLSGAISVGAGKFLGANGLGNIASTSNAAIGGDTALPGVTLSADRTQFKAGDSAAITFTFSEVPVGFGQASVKVSGGTLSGLAVDQNDAKVYHATFTPTAGVQSLSGAISIDAAKFLDAAGNAGTAGANVLSFGGDTRAPVVTDASLAVSGATGSNGSFRIGDTVTVAWNDGATGDQNGDTAAVKVDFSPFGGPAAATATLANGVWQASFQVTAGAIDAASLHAGITVTDLAGNTTIHTSSAGIALDNAAPAASDAALSLSGATGSGGAVRIGDVLTATWNGTLDGNADVASVSFDFSQFGGPAAVGASAVNGVWSASWTVAAGAIDASGRNVVMTVLDDAGNATTRADSAGLRVDTVAPQVASIALAGTPAANATSVEFTVSLSEAVSGLNAADFTLAATGAASGTIASVTGSGTSYTVRVDGIAGNGSLQLQLHDALNPIVDGAGNQMQGDYTAGVVHTTSFNALPVIGSNGGGASATINVAEKQLAVTTVNATDLDADTIGYSISGGLDASLFEIDAASGVLRFKSAPLSAAPADSGHDNVYEVEVMAADGKGGIDKQLLSVNVQADLDGDGTADANDNDIDNDGRPNSIEDAVPGALGGNGDGNGDGTPDSAQLNVASLPTVVAGAPYATLETAAGLTLSSVSSLAAASGLPRNVKMPVGQFDFTIGKVAPGGTATVSLYVDAALHVNGYFKQDAGGNWVNLATSVTTVGSKTKVTFSLVDGGVYDSDHLANGSITDPGGLVTVAALIGSNGGTPLASVAVLEGHQHVTTVAASGTGTVSYAIVGGADAALFALDPNTGVLRFKSAPDYDVRLDAGRDNVYEVKVQASDAFGSDTQTIQVSVADVPPPAKEVDGVQVVTDSRSNGDGTTSQVITVPVVLPTRTDSVGNNNVADVPLVTANDGKPVLSAQVPTGVGLQVSGTAAPVGVGTGLADLIREIKGVTAAGSHDQDTMTAGGSGFLSALSSNASLLVQTVVPTLASGMAAAQPVVITGTPAAVNGPLTALVIDAHQLPSGSEIQLQDVSFAAVVGNVRVTGGAGSQTVWADGGSQYIVLGADDDVLHGGAGNDTVGSEGGNDHVYGDEGNDLVFGGLGNDYVDGGSGIDTVQLVGGGRADYSIRVDGSGNLVFTHRNGGVDGVDTVANVEVLRFTHAHADGSQQGSVARLAEAITGTTAAPAALQGWMAELKGGATLAQVAQHMLAANAAQQPAGDADFVKALYVHTFGRAADAGGLAYWTEALAGGKLTRAEVSLAMADSTEKMAMPATVQLDVGATDYGTLVRMYDTLFGRSPDIDGINYWLGRTEAGASLASIADGFVQSVEGTARFGKMNDTEFVESLYHIALHRDGSQAEVSNWAKMIASGTLDRGDVLLQFAESSEKIGLVGVVTSTITPDGHA